MLGAALTEYEALSLQMFKCICNELEILIDSPRFGQMLRDAVLHLLSIFLLFL